MSGRFVPGATIPPVVVENLTRTDLVRYAGASGDFNPIHHDETFVGAGNLRRYKVRFATRVWPGDTITCTGTVTRCYEVDGQALIDGECVATNQKGETAVTGTFTAAVPAGA